MYKIKIMGKLEATTFSAGNLEKECVIISINDTHYDTVIYDNPKIKSVLKVWFDDIHSKEHEDEDLVLMTDFQARQIKEFIDLWKDQVDEIIFHCTAGISRSGAIGTSCARYLNGCDNYLWATGRYMPNRHVYKLMCEAFGLEYSDRLYKCKTKLKTKSDRSMMGIYSDYGVTIDDMFCDVVIIK